MDKLSSRLPMATLVFLDACRSFPIKRTTRAAPKGLVKIESIGSVVSFACGPGDQAQDGADPGARNGMYTVRFYVFFVPSICCIVPCEHLFTCSSLFGFVVMTILCVFIQVCILNIY